MKTKFFTAILALCTCLIFLAASPPACAQVGVVPRTTVLTNIPGVIAASFSSNVNSGIFPLYKGRGFSAFAKTAGTNAALIPGVTNTITFDVSFDGTNWSTASPLALVSVFNGTTNVIAWTNFPPTLVDNVRYGRVRTIYNGHTNSLFVSNIWVSITP